MIVDVSWISRINDQRKTSNENICCTTTTKKM